MAWQALPTDGKTTLPAALPSTALAAGRRHSAAHLSRTAKQSAGPKRNADAYAVTACRDASDVLA